MNPNATITDEMFEAYLKQIRELVEGPFEEMQKEIEVTNKFPDEFYELAKENDLYRFYLPVEYGGWNLDELEILRVQEEFSRGPGGMRMHLHHAADMNWRILEDYGTPEIKGQLMDKFQDKTIYYSTAEFDMLHLPAEDEARKAIRILNPISENLSIMRTLLAPSMLNVIVDNLKKGNAEGRLFEMAPVYLAKELPIKEHPHERQTLCLGAFGPEEDFFTVKGALEALADCFGLHFDYKRETTPWLHPGISAAVYCNGKRLGVFGKLANEINAELEIAKDQKDSQNIYLGELDYEALMSCVEGELRYQPLSPYAPVKRDLALVCDEAVTCGEIQETIQKASPLVSEVKLFDIYRGANLGEGKKSMAFSLSLADPKKEVSAEEAERAVKKILGNLKFKLGIEIR